MPAGQQVPLQPALAGVLGEDLHHPAVPREVLVDRQDRLLPGLPGHLEQRAEPVRLGLVRAEHPEVRGRGVAPHHVAQHPAEHPGRLRRRRSPARDRRPRSRGSRAAPDRAAAAPPLACGVAPSRRSPSGTRPSSSGRAARRRRKAPPAGRTRIHSSSCAGAPGWSGPRPAAPGAPARCPPPAARPPRPGRSSPSGCAARSSASAGASRRRPDRGPRPGWPGSRRRLVQRRGHLLVHDGGLVAGRHTSARSRSRAAARRARRPGSGPARSGWRSCSR